MATLQTLDRGIVALQVIARAPRGMTVQALADELGVHRAIAYRLVATLADHGLVRRLANGRLRLGPAVLDLAARYAPQFRDAHRDVLPGLAAETGTTAFIAVADGDEAVVVAVAEPPDSRLRVSYRLGMRHPLTRGAPGLAILALRPPAPDEPAGVAWAREHGYAHTEGELQPGAAGMSAGFRSADVDGSWQDASIGIVTLGPLDLEAATPVVLRAAERLRDA